MIEACVSALQDSRRIGIIAHIFPDGDALGSCLALGQALEALGKTVDLYCEQEPPALYRFLPGIHRFLKPAVPVPSYDLAAAVDCSDMGRMGGAEAVFHSGRRTLNIDHHGSNPGYASINWVDPSRAATGEMIYDLLRSFSIPLSKDIGTALYTALVTDTGSFQFQSTTPRTLRIAADLLDLGVSSDAVTTQLYRTLPLSRIKLLAQALPTLEIFAGDRAALLTVTRAMLNAAGAEDGDTENLINYAKDIEGVELGLLLKETAEGTVKISYRTKESMNAAELAAVFGGGGHPRAAGASLAMDLAAARSALLDSVSGPLEALDKP